MAGSRVSKEARGKADSRGNKAPTINIRDINIRDIIGMSVQDVKTYLGTLGKYTRVRHDLALLGKRNQGMNPIFKATPETGITEGYRLKSSIESPSL